MPGVTDCGSRGLTVSCLKLSTGFPFASLVPVTVGKPVVAVSFLIILPFESNCLVWPAVPGCVMLMIGFPRRLDASVSILTVIEVREVTFCFRRMALLAVVALISLSSRDVIR